MQSIDLVETELRRLGGNELLADARTEARTYAALFFPWDGHGEEPEARREARLRILTARLENAQVDHTSRADPDHPDPAAAPVDEGPAVPVVQGPAADLAARIAVNAQSCPLIAGLHGGRRDAIATDTDDGRLVGVRLDDDSVMVGVVAREHADHDRIIDQVRAAVSACTPTARIAVSVAARHHRRTDTVVDDGTT